MVGGNAMLGFTLRAAIMYFMALIMIRLLGKRALGELGPFDFVVMTGVGHTVVSVALDKSIPFYEGIVILLTLAVLECIMGFAALKNQRLSNLITGAPVVLIDKGRIVKDNLKKEKFNVDDLMQELRKKGIRDIDEVDKGILESCGGFSVILREEDEPVTRRDLGISPPRRTELLTIQGYERGEFFQKQQDVSWQDKAFVPLADSLLKIDQRLQELGEQIEKLEKRFDSEL